MEFSVVMTVRAPAPEGIKEWKGNRPLERVYQAFHRHHWRSFLQRIILRLVPQTAHNMPQDKYFSVYKVQYRLAVQDEDIPQPRYHTVVSNN